MDKEAYRRQNKKLKQRIKDLENFLRWMLVNGGTDMDILLALDPKMSMKEYRRIDVYGEKAAEKEIKKLHTILKIL